MFVVVGGVVEAEEGMVRLLLVNAWHVLRSICNNIPHSDIYGLQLFIFLCSVNPGILHSAPVRVSLHLA